MTQLLAKNAALAIGIVLINSSCKVNSHLHKRDTTSELTSEISPLERQELIRKAEVFDPNIQKGPEHKALGIGPDDPFFKQRLNEFSCLFNEPDPLDPPGGRTPKFECTILNKDGTVMLDHKGQPRTVKVKYDPAYVAIDGKFGKTNEEVYGEVLSTRLLWAIGFGSDKVYPAKVTCKNCPIDPWSYIRKVTNILDNQDFLIGFVRSEVLKNKRYLDRHESYEFQLATVEVKHSGKKIDGLGGIQGWKWGEMYEFMNPEQKVERDMLTLFASFIDHMDNKSSQQRLICLSGKATPDCSSPLLMIQDAGSAFGNGWAPFQGDLQLNKMDLKKWTALSVWKDPRNCLAQVHGAPNASFRTTWKVTDAARERLGHFLGRLTDEQLLELFETARVDKMKKPNASLPEGWVNGFKAKLKRDLIDTRCGSSIEVY